MKSLVGGTVGEGLTVQLCWRKYVTGDRLQVFTVTPTSSTLACSCFEDESALPPVPVSYLLLDALLPFYEGL